MSPKIIYWLGYLFFLFGFASNLWAMYLPLTETNNLLKLLVGYLLSFVSIFTGAGCFFYAIPRIGRNDSPKSS